MSATTKMPRWRPANAHYARSECPSGQHRGLTAVRLTVRGERTPVP